MIVFGLIAGAHLGGNLIASAIVLAIGCFLLNLVQASDKERDGLPIAPIAALVMGPALAALFLALDILWLSPTDYLFPQDAGVIPSVMAIGLVAGVLGAVAFWIESQIRGRSTSTADDSDTETS
ncbi:MAG: hypothetical protein AAFV43_04320 [Planctomycetota bacterium]